MNKEFIHLSRYTFRIALVVLGGMMLFILYKAEGNISWVALLLIGFLGQPGFLLFLLLFIYWFIQHNDKIILTQTGIIKKNFTLKKYLAYETVISVEETSGRVILIGKNDRISINSQMANFSELYGLLLQRIPALRVADNGTFPLKISKCEDRLFRDSHHEFAFYAKYRHLKPRHDIFKYIENIIMWFWRGSGETLKYQGDVQELMFASDAIAITTIHEHIHWEIAQLRKIKFQRTYHEGNRRIGWGLIEEYYAVRRLTISFYTGHDFVFDPEQIEAFGYSPERLALILRQLYPDKFFSNVYGKITDETQQDHDQAEAHLAWGDRLRREGRYKQAIDEYMAAIDLNPEHREHMYEIGNLLFELDRYNEATIAYREMLTYSPNHEPSRERLNLCLFISGRNKGS